MITGWEASRYCRRMGPIGAVDLEVIDAPDDAAPAAAMRRVDVAVQLRAPTFGESSGVVCQLLALGTPLVVTGEGSFAELPADAAERRQAIVAALSQEAFTALIEAILDSCHSA